MSFAQTLDRRNVTIHQDEMTLGVPSRVNTYRRYRAPSAHNKPMAVEGITVEWRREGDGPWTIYVLRVYGAVIKKNGEPGQIAGQRDYIDYGNANDIEMDAWLLAEIALYAPSGDAW